MELLISGLGASRPRFLDLAAIPPQVCLRMVRHGEMTPVSMDVHGYVISGRPDSTNVKCPKDLGRDVWVWVEHKTVDV